MKPIQDFISSQSLAAGALTHDVVIGAARSPENDVELLSVMLKAGSAISQTVSVSHVGKEGANYVFVLDSSSLSSATNYVFRPSGVPPVFKRGDTVRVTCTNADTPAVTVYSKIQLRECV